MDDVRYWHKADIQVSVIDLHFGVKEDFAQSANNDPTAVFSSGVTFPDTSQKINK